MISNKKSCKVCIFSTLHDAFDNRIFHKEARAIYAAGYDVTLIACRDKDEISDGIKIIALHPAKNRFTRMTFMAVKVFVIAIKQRADIYHFHDPELIGVALLLKLSTRAKIIYDVHEDTPKSVLSKEWINIHIRDFTSLVFDKIEKLLSRYFDCVFAATVSIADNFKKGNVVLLANYPDIGRFLKAEKDILSKGIIKNKEYTLVYCGGLTKIRGIKEIVLSLGFIDFAYNVKLKLAGQFNDTGYEKEVRGLKEWDRVDYLGHISKEKVIENLYIADCGLVCLWPEPNHIESLGDKLLEYMAAGLPVVASNFPLWKKIVEGSDCGICVNPMDPGDIARAVEFLTKNTENAKQMGKNGRKAVLERYSWEKESEKLKEIYDKLCIVH